MKVVLDTNVFVSGILNRRSNAGFILDQCREGLLTLALSKPMIDELGRVLHKPYLRQRHRWNDARISEYLANLMEMSDFVPVSESVAILDRDPTDSFSLDCAVQARADLIVSGDPDLIELGSYQGIPIVTLVECVARIRTIIS